MSSPLPGSQLPGQKPGDANAIPGKSSLPSGTAEQDFSKLDAIVSGDTPISPSASSAPPPLLYPAPETDHEHTGAAGPTSVAAPSILSGAMTASTDESLDYPVDLQTFRVLMGLPNGETATNPPPKLPIHPWLPSFVRSHIWPYDPEQPTSMYFTLLQQERQAKRRYRLYDFVVYACLFLQLALSATLVTLAALPPQHHITLAVLGSINGVIAGILSLVKGQGLPMRLMKYADGLRKVREDIEWFDRELRANARVVTMKDCKKLRESYLSVRDDEIKNSPDVWNTGIAATSVSGTGGKTGPGGPGGASRAPTMTMGGGAGPLGQGAATGGTKAFS